MTRIACLMTDNMDELLLRPWLLHHGYLFGFESLYLIDHDYTSQAVQDVLRDFAALGCNVMSGRTANELSNHLLAEGGVDVVFALPCTDFLALLGSNGITCSRSAINDEVARIADAKELVEVQWALENWPGYLDAFRYVQVPFWISARGAEVGAKPGTTTLLSIRLRYPPLLAQGASYGLLAEEKIGATEAYYGDQRGYAAATLRYRGIWRQLAAMMDVGELERQWQVGRPANLLEDRVVWDLDAMPFSPGAYLAANPDLTTNSNLDPFAHFVRAGIFEGRRYNVSDEAAAKMFTIFERLRRVTRDGVAGYVGLANVCHAARCLAEGEEVLRQGVIQYGETAKLVFEFALIALYRQNHSDSIDRWERFIALAPDRPEGYRLLATTCRQVQDFARAEAVLGAGLARFPNDIGMLISRIDLAADCADRSRVKQLWFQLLQKFPDDREVRRRAGGIATFLGAWDQEQTSDVKVEEYRGPVVVDMADHEIEVALARLGFSDTSEMRNFFLQFQSLGSSCEFGLVQRRYGAEPISLLRWNSINPTNLIRGLETRFEALDEPGNLDLTVVRREFILFDRKYSMAMHTFTMEGAVERDKFLAQQVKRAKYLCGNLLADLEEGEKLFVYIDETEQPHSEIARLGRAIRSYGNSTLLYVRVTSDVAKTGKVELGGEGLIFGYISRPGRLSSGEWNIDFQNWEAVCVAGAKLWKSVAHNDLTAPPARLSNSAAST